VVAKAIRHTVCCLQVHADVRAGRVATRIRLEATENVSVVAKTSNGGLRTASGQAQGNNRRLWRLIGPSSAPLICRRKSWLKRHASSGTGGMQKKGEIIQIKTLVEHLMGRGQRRDKDGKLIHRLIINNFTCTFNGKRFFLRRKSAVAAILPHSLQGSRKRDVPKIQLDRRWTAIRFG